MFISADGEDHRFRSTDLLAPLSLIPRFIDNLPVEVDKACKGLRYQSIYCVNIGSIERQFQTSTGSTITRMSFPFIGSLFQQTSVLNVFRRERARSPRRWHSRMQTLG